MMMLKANHGMDGGSTKNDLLLAEVMDSVESSHENRELSEPSNSALELSPRYQRLKALTEQAA